MAGEHGIIDPFVGQQVRQNEVMQPVISYGLSSYGYDFRVADEFRIFTNAYNGEADPKNFPENAFITIKNAVGKVYIPPNSFALAKTVEYFRIPRKILTICVGKSTYARCFSGDTKVELADGTAPTIEEMARTPDEVFFGYGVLEDGEYCLTALAVPRYIGRDSLVELTLDDGSVIKCTADHEFLRHNGVGYTQAANLRPGDGLVPLYRTLARGYEQVWIPPLGTWLPTHWLADLWNVRNGVYKPEASYHRHHLDHNRRNNNPWNITLVDRSEHIRNHNAQYYAPTETREGHSLLIKQALREKAQNPEWSAAYSEKQKARAMAFHTLPEYAEKRAARAAKIRQSWANRRAGNHKISSIRELPGSHDVYCLTSLDSGNFVTSGVVVRNCGIIVNVTPFEPEWEGYATLEISNTGPLPAPIYPNEGIAQLLFLESDEECEVSYADRQGRYNRQQGIVLANVGR